MEYIKNIPEEKEMQQQILCCECGTPITPKAANMCVACLRSQVDITEGIPKQAVLYFCRSCERYLRNQNDWLYCTLHSRELLSLCLKKLRGLDRVKLIDATFVYTEPNSKRIKIKLTVSGEVIGWATLQQIFVVEYIVQHQMCKECHRVEAKDYWRALVQVRQKSENKKTFSCLEQQILKHGIHETTLGIKHVQGGIDFFYATEAQARKMVDFLITLLPCKYQETKKLLSHDIHSNTYNFKLTYCVDIVPISKNSVVCLSKQMAHTLGGISPVCLVYRVTNTLHLIDPTTAQIAEMTGVMYWREEFSSICNPKQLVEYVVMDIEPITHKERRYFPGQGTVSMKHILADAWVVKASELGVNNNMIHTKTHLGHVLKPGDSVLGYNIQESNINNENFEKLKKHNVPDVVLVSKHYADKADKA